MNRNERGLGEVGVIVWGVIGFFVILLAIWGLSVWLSPMFGKGDAYKEVQGDGTYRNAVTTEFFNKCAAIQSAETKIDTFAKAVKNAAGDPVSQHTARTNLSAAINARAELVNQYNANVKNATVKGFLKADSLPTYIDLNERNTQCQ
jgi:hypothetical protein